jgi:ubiquinone biosynthesis protein UbiJ
LQFVGASRLLPALPPAVIQISPAGLLDIDVTGIETPDLRVSIDAGHPARMALALLAGERPAIDVQGDAALAADVSWLAEHLRWDVEADLERLFGPVPARELGRVGRAVLAGVRALVRSGQALAARA